MKKVKYNRFLSSSERIPRRTLYRRKHPDPSNPDSSSTSACASTSTECDSRITVDAVEVLPAQPNLDGEYLTDPDQEISYEHESSRCDDALQKSSSEDDASEESSSEDDASEESSSEDDASEESSSEDDASQKSSSKNDASQESSSEDDTRPSDDIPCGASKVFEFEEPFSPLYPSADVTNLDAFLCLLAFIVRFNLSGACVEELLRLLKILLPPCMLPGSKYLLNKKINCIGDFENLFEIHFYCKKCNEYLCQMSEQEEVHCSTCEEKTSPVEQLDNGNFFIYLPLKQQLKAKFEKQGLFSEVRNHCMNFSQKVCYSEIVHGNMYPKSKMMDNISLQFNVDGMPLYQKAKYDIWPIHAMINELPPVKRRENMMMCGLWFGSQKPKMQTYLKPFIDELNDLSEKGLKWENNGKTFFTKVFPLICTADAPARAMLQNFTQYNGKYGCGFCENKGERVEKGRGFCHIYKPLNPSPNPRTLTKTVEYAATAISTDKPEKGVKGVSLLMQLFPHFNVIQGFVPDYMHCALLGVTRQFVHLWLDSTNAIYSLKNKQIAELNKRISCLKEPNEMTRKLRTLSEVSHWKASEWRVFLLVSPVLLLNLLDSKVYKHWILFVHAISLLLGSNISSENIEDAETAVKKFTFGVGDIYGEEELTYNVHILSHLPQSVRSWGPLWAISCFSFEDALGKLKSFHKGTKGVPQQILFAYLRKTLLKSLIVETDVRNVRAESFIKDMVRGHRETKKVIRINECILLGYGTSQELPTFEKISFEKHTNTILDKKVNLFKRMFYKDIMFTTKEYSDQYKRNNSIVSIFMSKLLLIEIIKIIVHADKIFFLGSKIKFKHFAKSDNEVGNLCSNILYEKKAKNVENFHKTLIVFTPKNIIQKYATVNFEDIDYFIPLLLNAEE